MLIVETYKYSGYYERAIFTKNKWNEFLVVEIWDKDLLVEHSCTPGLRFLNFSHITFKDKF